MKCFVQSVDVFLQAVNGQISISKVRFCEKLKIIFTAFEFWPTLGPCNSPNSGMLSKITTRSAKFSRKNSRFFTGSILLYQRFPLLQFSLQNSPFKYFSCSGFWVCSSSNVCPEFYSTLPDSSFPRSNYSSILINIPRWIRKVNVRLILIFFKHY